MTRFVAGGKLFNSHAHYVLLLRLSSASSHRINIILLYPKIFGWFGPVAAFCISIFLLKLIKLRALVLVLKYSSSSSTAASSSSASSTFHLITVTGPINYYHLADFITIIDIFPSSSLRILPLFLHFPFSSLLFSAPLP